MTLTFPLLALPAVAVSLYFAVKLWATGAWSVRRRVSYSASTLSAVLFLLILNYWNLLGYRFG